MTTARINNHSDWKVSRLLSSGTMGMMVEVVAMIQTVASSCLSRAAVSNGQA